MPVIPISVVPNGAHEAIINEVGVKLSRNDNPQVVLELQLDTGQLIDDWFVIHADGNARLEQLIGVCYPSLVGALWDRRSHRKSTQLPDFELETLEGCRVQAWVKSNLVTGYSKCPTLPTSQSTTKQASC